jgi:hypothetical protein
MRRDGNGGCFKEKTRDLFGSLPVPFSCSGLKEVIFHDCITGGREIIGSDKRKRRERDIETLQKTNDNGKE